MAYTPEQKKIARRIYRIGRKRNASRKELLSALETGLVESNLTNIKGGDRDSSGWRQERAMYYKNPNNVVASVNRYYDETKKAGPKNYKTAGQLSQAVQRSAYPGRYDERKGQALDLLKYLREANGGMPKGGSSGGSRSRTRTSREVEKTTRMVNPGAEQALSAARMSYLMEGRYKGMKGLLDLAQAKKGIAAMATPVTDTKVTNTKNTVRGKKATRGKPGKQGGKKGTAVPTSPIGSYKRAGRLVEKEVLPIAQRLGIDVTPASVRAANARHGPTVSGGVSDHQGNFKDVWAADLSNGSAPTKQMDLAAARIAKKFGIPWSGAGAVSHTANGYRYQLIYRSNVGGNHFNHIHIGVRKA